MVVCGLVATSKSGCSAGMPYHPFYLDRFFISEYIPAGLPV
jgi:hypothetical protein